jgi:hypothetical protein
MEDKVLDILPQTWWERVLGKVTVAYVDTHDLFLDREFFTPYKVRAEFKSHRDDRFRLRILRIPFKRLDAFKRATGIVRKNAIICGHSNFDEIFNTTKKLIDEE